MSDTFTNLPSRTKEFKFREEYAEAIRLKALGYRTRDIARTLNMSYHTVQQALSCPFGRRMLADLQDARNGSVMDINERLQEMAGDAVDFMEKIMDDEVDTTVSLKLKVAESILDRAGHGRMTKNLTLGLTGTLGAEEIAEIRLRAQQSGIIDVQHTTAEDCADA